ncbi:uncharacterized protein Gasu_39640 [Galdieria sulphuraria]|uniref:Methyltransferase type 12 domain-containing protein n=1 Tax=Galdieria sulphuraria TaxID=130081 RepID=M2XY58_GALSU|nr:uncharacterized protein Gasu_39640 [Galdieria sulphuraria]EME28588.1 hypothetical protein Gasu_39640 [Galdieria sulphuraria]|eukprot:XP_005705108.1 hypothetical protein Gasu_39640 [Galdieria sulphuraria]
MASIPFSDPEEYRKQFGSAAERNKLPILEALKRHVTVERAKALELASGIGTHVSFFAENFPNWTFQPSDVDPVHVELIAQKTQHLKNVLPPVVLNVSSDNFADTLNDEYDIVMVSNLLHVAGWQVSIGLFHGCSRVLRTDGLLFIYGPFKRNGTYNAESNQKFDEFLKSRNPEFGLKDIDDLERLAHGCKV